MAVCFDRNEGALPSRRTGMAGKDNGGMATLSRKGTTATRPFF